MLGNLWTVGMATEDGPRLSAHSALRAFALHPAWRTPAITPDVPFCAAARVATAVVLARRSEVGRRREIADSKCADIRRHSQSLWSPGASFEPEKSLRRPCWSRKLHAPGTALWPYPSPATRTTRPSAGAYEAP